MQQFVVPQFIEVENKIIGVITVRQFVLMMIALFVSIASYRFADFGLFVFLTVINFLIAGVFGFAKVNGRPLHYFLISFIKTKFAPNIVVWDKRSSEIVGLAGDGKVVGDKEKPESLKVKKMEKSRLSEISLVLDTGGRYQGDID